jgi:hypothetical protein
VALSVLGNNNASLIGVAISASLLPPAVNCGMALASALFLFATELCTHQPHSFTSGSGSNSGSGSGSAEEYRSADFLLLGVLSLALTLVNIAAIFLSALGMFRLKEVAPVVSKGAFWREDVKLCRGLNKTQKKDVAKQLLKRQSKTSFGFPIKNITLPPLHSPFSFSTSSSYSYGDYRAPSDGSGSEYSSNSSENGSYSAEVEITSIPGPTSTVLRNSLL